MLTRVGVRAVIWRIYGVLLCLVTGLLFSACGAATAPLDSSQASKQELKASAATVTVYPETWQAGGSGKLRLSERSTPEAYVIDLNVDDAKQLKGLFFKVDFDPQRFTPSAVASRRRIVAPGQGLQLELMGMGQQEYAEMLTRPQDPDSLGLPRGFSGSGVLATITLLRRPQPAMRQLSEVPVTTDSQSTLSIDAASKTIRWSHRSVGDYNQDGQVSIQDLSPIGIHFQEDVPLDAGGPDGRDYDSVQDVIDGNNDGVISVQDLTPIGMHYRKAVDGYRIYLNADPGALPIDPAEDAQFPADSEVPMDTALGVNTDERLYFEHSFLGLDDGIYIWVRPFDNDAEGVPSNAVQYLPSNQVPVADLQADQTSGNAPLLVTFDAGASADPDGSIAKYEYDWDGAGTDFAFEDLGLQSSPQHSFDSAGTFDATVRVTDNQGATATASISITVSSGGLQPPEAVMDASPQSGNAPLIVDFDATNSSDPDGSITLYEWDLDGDGTFEISGTDTAQITYDAPGIKLPVLRVTDNDNQTDTGGVPITVLAAGTPTASLEVSPSEGQAPLDVLLDGSNSSDAGGTIVKYEWDYDGDGSYDDETGAVPSISHTYLTPGNFTARLRVTDDEDNTSIDEKPISVLPSGPVAALFAKPRYGPVPLTVNFDASGSTSANTITKYEWDWDGNGTYDQDSGTTAAVSHVFMTPGVFNSKVRVTDNTNATGEKIMLVMPTVDSSFPPSDCVFVLPSQSIASAGEKVGLEVYTKSSANPLQYPFASVTLEDGNTYVSMSYNIGEFGGDSLASDGDLWTAMNPASFLNFPDNFLTPYDIGGGRNAIDLGATPLGGSDVSNATGALFNITITVNSNITLGIQRIKDVDRTYYQNSLLGSFYWSGDNNAGLPGITLQ